MGTRFSWACLIHCDPQILSDDAIPMNEKPGSCPGLDRSYCHFAKQFQPPRSSRGTAGQFFNWKPRFGLSQKANDLLLAESLLHVQSSLIVGLDSKVTRYSIPRGTSHPSRHSAQAPFARQASRSGRSGPGLRVPLELEWPRGCS